MQAYEYVLSERSEIARLLPDSYRTVLEIGCAKGGFKANLNPNAEVWGIEPRASAAGHAAALGYKVLVGIYDAVAAEIPDAYFDLVVCNDVIEHMTDHDKFLQDIKRKMKPDACIVGSVPNVRYFGNMVKLVVLKDWHYEEQGILDRTHLRFFTGKSLRETFVRNGYEVQQLKGVNSDFAKFATVKLVLKNMLLAATIALSLGHCRDLRFLQYGFRLTLR